MGLVPRIVQCTTHTTKCSSPAPSYTVIPFNNFNSSLKKVLLHRALGRGKAVTERAEP